MPKPAADTGRPYAPQAILPGGIVVPLFPPDSPYLKADKLHVPEVYNMSQAVPGRISSIVSIHNPSIELHLVEKSINTGTAIIVIAGGGHRTLNVGGEAADFVPFFFNYGINTIILRNRLRADGYVAEVDAVHDAQQAVRVVRAYAKEWGIDPKRIGVMGFSAGAELASPAAVLYDDWDKKNNDPADPFAGISSRPDFAALVYPGPTPFARNRTAPPIPKDAPPAFLICGGAGDRVHAVWALDYYQAMLMAGVPNVEIAPLRQRTPPGRPAAGRGPHVRRPDRPRRHPLRDLAASLHRLGAGPRLPPEARRRDQGREGRGHLRSQPAPSLRTGPRRRRPTRPAARKTRSGTRRSPARRPAVESGSTTFHVTGFCRRPWRPVVRGSACPARYCTPSGGTPRDCLVVAARL